MLKDIEITVKPAVKWTIHIFKPCTVLHHHKLDSLTRYYGIGEADYHSVALRNNLS